MTEELADHLRQHPCVCVCYNKNHTPGGSPSYRAQTAGMQEFAFVMCNTKKGTHFPGRWASVYAVRPNQREGAVVWCTWKHCACLAQCGWLRRPPKPARRQTSYHHFRSCRTDTGLPGNRGDGRRKPEETVVIRSSIKRRSRRRTS